MSISIGSYTLPELDKWCSRSRQRRPAGRREGLEPTTSTAPSWPRPTSHRAAPLTDDVHDALVDMLMNHTLDPGSPAEHRRRRPGSSGSRPRPSGRRWRGSRPRGSSSRSRGADTCRPADQPRRPPRADRLPPADRAGRRRRRGRRATAEQAAALLALAGAAGGPPRRPA